MGLMEDKVVLVTGAGSGIGRATAVAAAREGAAGVIVADLDDVAAAETLAEVAAFAATRVIAIHTDVSVEADVRRMVETSVSTFGRLDCAVNNAGTSLPPTRLTDLTLVDWSRLIGINLTSVYLCLRFELAEMAAIGGSIVNVASIAGFTGTVGHGAYGATKHGVLGLTKCAALEGAPSGIRVNTVCPGRTDTPLLRAGVRGYEDEWAARSAEVPLGRIAAPDELAEAIVWLCSDRASFVTGESMVVDGGMYVTQSR